MAGPTIDDLLRAADKGAPIGTTQRYFKTSPPPVTTAPTPAQAPAQPSLQQGGESEKEMIDRILGRKKQSMSDAPGELAAGQQYAMAETGAPPERPAAKTDRVATLKAVRAKYPMYSDMPDDDLARALAAKYPAYADLVTTETPKPKPKDGRGALGKIGQIVREEAGKVPGRVKEDLAGLAESVANPKMTTLLPLTLGPGSTVATRLGALGAGAMLDQPSTSPSQNIATAAKDIAAGGAAELFAGLLPRVKIPMVGKMGEAAETKAARRRAYEWAKEAPEKALEVIRDRLPKGKWLNVPSLSSKKISVDEAVKGLQKLEGLDYQTARAEIISEFNALDIQRAGAAGLARKGPRPYAGQAFSTRTSPELFTPPKGSAFERFSESVVPALNDPALRTAADIAATHEEGGVPIGLIPPAALGQGAEGFGSLARHLLMR